MARTVADAGGNVTHSKMIRLGQEFTTLMHVGIEPEKRGDLIKSLRDSKDLKLLNIRASSLTRRQTGYYKSSIVGLKIHVIGPDRYDDNHFSILLFCFVTFTTYTHLTLYFTGQWLLQYCSHRPGMLANIAEMIGKFARRCIKRKANTWINISCLLI